MTVGRKKNDIGGSGIKGGGHPVAAAMTPQQDYPSHRRTQQQVRCAEAMCHNMSCDK
jgi:hypothetical protein